MKLQKIFLQFLFSAVFFGVFAFLALSNVSAATNTVKEVTLKNPLKVGSIEDLLVAILSIIMVLMVPVIVFFIIYSGFKYVMAQGNASQVEEATKSLTYAIIGGVLILAALAISEIIKNVVKSFAAN